MQLNKLKRFAGALGLGLLVACTIQVQASDDPLLGAERQLGEVREHFGIGDDWIYVRGTRDEFLMTRNGRFTLMQDGGELQLTDIWQSRAINFSELEEARNIIPLDNMGLLPGSSRAPDEDSMVLGNASEMADIKATAFVLMGDKHTGQLLSEVDWDAANYAINVVMLPHNDRAEYMRFACSSKSVRKAVLLGEDLTLDDPGSNCDQQQKAMNAGKTMAVIRLLGLDRSPYIIRHSDWQGRVLVEGLEDFIL